MVNNKTNTGPTEPGRPSDEAGPSNLRNESSTITLRQRGGTFGENVEGNIKAGPHGALIQPDISHDRWSLTSTHTMLLKHHKEGEVDLDVPVDFEEAIEETGHGCFQYKLMFLCGFVYACCSLSTTTLSIVLPAATYDFNMDSEAKGVLNTAPLWGMMVGAYIWGNFADNKGRRFVLLWALVVDATASFLSSFSQHYEMFYVIRIFNGFGIIGATSIVFAYMGEFLDVIHRDTYLARLELFWTLGIIALPCIGLAILPIRFSWGSKDTFLYNSWRLFVFTCGLPSLIAVLMILRMPESPRFLLIQGKLDKARNVLLRMFVSNTGKPKEEFSVNVLSESAEADMYFFKRVKHASFKARVGHFLRAMYKQHMALFTGRSFFNILITCYVDFGLISVYYTMMLWVPELLNRQEHYVILNPNETATLCKTAGFPIEEKFESDIKIETFIHIIVTCLACMPTTLLLLYLIHHMSKKKLLVGIMVVAAVPAYAITWANSVSQVVIMFSSLKSMTNLAEAVLFCAIVEIFPITTRGSALSLTVTAGRLGSILGNIIFGMYIDTNCENLFYVMALNLVLSGLACLLLPRMGRAHGAVSAHVVLPP